MLKNKKALLIFVLLITAGVIYRLKIASFFPHQPRGDEISYTRDIPLLMEKNFWFADCCARPYIYPFFILILYKLSGVFNYSAITTVQMVMDTVISLLLYSISYSLFKKRIWAFITFIIYLFNPLTASYTGLYLSEILALFILTLAVYFLIKRASLKYSFLTGFLIGLFAFTRTVLFWWALGLMVCLFFYYMMKKKNGLLLGLTGLFAFALTAIYPVYANWKYFHSFSPVPVIPVGLQMFVQSLKIHKWPAIVSEYYNEVPDKLIYLSIENYSDPVLFRKTITPDLIKTKDYIFSHPAEYALSRLQHFRNYWDKTNLYYYEDPFLWITRPYLNVLNWIFLILCMAGIAGILFKKKKNDGEIKLLILICLLIFYYFLPLSLFVPEERYTLPVYPVIALFLPIGGAVVLRSIVKFSHLLKSKK